MAGMSSLVRIVNAGVPGSQDRVDVVLRDGVVASVGPAGTVSASDSTMQTKAHTTSLEYATNAIASGSVSIPTSAAAPADETTIDADGLWVIPGLWDCHTHFTQWAKTLGRLDLINARSAAEAMDMLRRHLDERRAADTLDPDAFVVGMRFRHSLWADDEQPTLAAIDAVTGEQPVALSSADMHCGWVNSAAARRLGVHVDESGLVGELEWFNAYTAFDKAPGAAEETDRLLREAEQDAASKGVVGIRDYEMAENIDTWINRFAAGINGLRVDAGVYPERLRAAIDAGWHTGKELPGSAGLGHVGAMKLISDGSLNTRSAYCSTPYSGIEPLTYGTLSYTPQQIEDYMRLATEHGFDIACHAIGDEANTIALNAVAATHAHGSIEHAQMLKPVDIPRFAELEVTAVADPYWHFKEPQYWESKESPLDPWLAISAAVLGTESSDREPFQPEQCLDVHTSLAASTATGRDRLASGDPADVVLLDADPYAADTPEAMRAMPQHVVMTLLCGERTY